MRISPEERLRRKAAMAQEDYEAAQAKMVRVLSLEYWGLGVGLGV